MHDSLRQPRFQRQTLTGSPGFQFCATAVKLGPKLGENEDLYQSAI